MGKLSRTKGRRWEQRVANMFRKKYPQATVRRSQQAHRAYEPDIVIEDAAPLQARNLWLELQDARRPNPTAKLRQARWDMARAYKSTSTLHTAVVVWHRLGEKTAYATLSLSEAAAITGLVHSHAGMDPDITMSLEDFLRMLPE